MDNYLKSKQLFEEAKQYFPGGVNSPVRAFKSVIGTPLFIRRGKGCRITCEDNRDYIDFCCSWGPLILGHDHETVREKIIETVRNGTSFGTPTRLGNELGALILNHHHYIEQMRFVSSGTEAVMSAIRLARGFTGKNKILKFEGCYHGHVDALLVKAGSGLATFGVSTSAGIPPAFAGETMVLPLNQPELLSETLKAHQHELAAVIIEPIPANNGLLLQNSSFLKHLREECTRYDILLIFDEVISGFRVGFEGAAGLYKIQPDIITFGKIIGGGLPVGAFASRREIMQKVSPEGPVYQAGTLSANPVAMAAGVATLQELLRPGFYEALQNKTQSFVNTLREHIQTKSYPMHIPQVGSIFWLAFAPDRIVSADQIQPESMEYFKKLHAWLLERGIYLGPSGYEVGFVSAAHTEQDLDQAAELMIEGLDNIFTG